MPSKCFIFFITFLFCGFHLNNGFILEQVGRMYLENIGDGLNGVENIAIDTIDSNIFTANGFLKTIDVISFEATRRNIYKGNIPMKFEKSILVQPAVDKIIDDITSVTISSLNGVIATVVPLNHSTEFGYLYFIDPDLLQIVNVLELTDCYLPDHVTVTHDDKETIIIACEGEPDDNKAEFPDINPPGSIAIVEYDEDKRQYIVFNVNFEEFNKGGSKRLPDGIYQPYPNEPFSINVEPEYSTVDKYNKYVYITLQENNGVAVLDIDKQEIIHIFSLGVHDFSVTGLDASDKDNAINIATYSNLFGLRMPDSIDFVEIKGKEYIVTANEGDSKDFDESRVGDDDIILNHEAFPNGDDLKSVDKLGRLKIINQLGKNVDGEFEKLFTFNSRDFTIWEIKRKYNKIDKIELVYSSLDDFAQITADALGMEGFNSNVFNPSFDERSDDKGAEPETVVVGKCSMKSNGKRKRKRKIYSFIGLERVGGIMIYDITNINNIEPVEYFNNRDFTVEYEEDTRPPIEAGDTAPEQLKFIEEDVYGIPLLFGAFTESSSIAIYSVNCGCHGHSNSRCQRRNKNGKYYNE